jgi:DNA polymerase-3 subunit beta
MKLIILKKNLKDGLNVIQGAISDNNNLPILKYVLLIARNNQIKLVATNLELAISAPVPGKIIDEGAISLPFSVFSNIISNTDNERVDLELKENAVLINTDNYGAKIQALPESDFPIIPKLENIKESIEIQSEIFKEALIQVVNAAQISEIRPELSGVLFDFQLTVFKLAATDSFRLAEKNISDNQIKSSFRAPWKSIIPLKTIGEIIKICDLNSSTFIYRDNNQILIKNDKAELISRVLEGNYPDYEQIIPKNNEVELVFEKEHLIKALKLVSTFSSKINDVRFRVRGDKKVLDVYSSSQHLGENNYLIPVKISSPVDSDIAFNWRYVLDGVKILSSNQISLALSGEIKPAVIKPLDDPSYFYLVMPIRNS